MVRILYDDESADGNIVRFGFRFLTRWGDISGGWVDYSSVERIKAHSSSETVRIRTSGPEELFERCHCSTLLSKVAGLE